MVFEFAEAAWPNMQVSRVRMPWIALRACVVAAGPFVQTHPVPWEQNHVRPGRVNREEQWLHVHNLLLDCRGVEA